MMIQCGNSVCRVAKLQSLSRAFLGDCAPGHVAVAKKPSAKRAAHLKTCVSAVSQNISEEYQSVEFDFACPICTTTLFKLRQTGGKPTGDLTCPRCQRTFSASSASVDLTLTSGVQQKVYEQRSWGGTEIFRNPLVSLAYERGWRQGFAWAGFPGVDRETEIALEYLKPAYGEVLVDMSCGSGLFSRKFLASGNFSGVIAADFSESMLREARSYFEQDTSLDSGKYLLVRADVARLPFATGSLAAINASAAIHCWPNPQAALVEISRCLRPGGVFVASTFLSGIAPLGQILGNDDLVRPLRGLEPTTGSYRWWEEDELKDLCTAMGLQGFERERNNRFIMFTVRKPGIHGD
ncbi:hypothetical protein Ndes2437B_g03960 [Nannochloris sp. 'desiccata']|nr:hypothetical protein KSW81_003464 [Chlorella desiccata (nom. nud.)]